jgi:predicted dehydrogenase
VGCGSIGKRHLRAFKKIKGVEVIPCDPRKEVLKEIAESYSLAEVYKDIKEVNLEGIDGMVICTPPHTHIPIALEGARANCHLLVEKPFSNKLDGIEELIQLTHQEDARGKSHRQCAGRQGAWRAVFSGLPT